MNIIIIINECIIKIDLKRVLRNCSILTILRNINKLDSINYAEADYIIIDSDDYTDGNLNDKLKSLPDVQSKVIILSSQPETTLVPYSCNKVFRKPFISESVKDLIENYKGQRFEEGALLKMAPNCP